jgi:hypothetical protein
MVSLNRFYTYAYLREDRTPYYIGKGQKNRIYRTNRRKIKPPKDKSRIIFLKQNLTEEEAFRHEKYMIAVFGRKDLGTGILHNRTDGGEGMSGYKHSEEFIERMKTNNPSKDPRVSKIKSEKLSGKNNPMYGRKGKDSPNYGKSRTKESIEKRTETFCKNNYAIISPEGKKFITKNIAKFCREHNLDKHNMSSVVSGKSKHHKGWVCSLMEESEFPKNLVKYEPRKYYIVSPDGNKYVTENLKQFSIEKNLQHSEMYRLINGKLKSYKGWTGNKIN